MLKITVVGLGLGLCGLANGFEYLNTEKSDENLVFLGSSHEMMDYDYTAKYQDVKTKTSNTKTIDKTRIYFRPSGLQFGLTFEELSWSQGESDESASISARYIFGTDTDRPIAIGVGRSGILFSDESKYTEVNASMGFDRASSFYELSATAIEYDNSDNTIGVNALSRFGIGNGLHLLAGAGLALSNSTPQEGFNRDLSVSANGQFGLGVDIIGHFQLTALVNVANSTGEYEKDALAGTDKLDYSTTSTGFNLSILGKF